MVTSIAALSLSDAHATRRLEYVAAGDGLRLASAHFGDETSPSLVFAHGFGQTRHAWDAASAALADAGFHCVSADARGHGDSGWCSDGKYDYTQFIDDLVRLARATTASKPLPILIGASMGGLIGLSAEAIHAPLFRALVLVDITPRWEAAGVARILDFMRAHPQGFANLDEAARAIALYLPQRSERYASDQRPPQRLRRMLIAGPDGRLRWHWDPCLLDYVATQSEQQQTALLEAARRIRIPTLLISGEHSDVVSAATVGEFLEHVPHAQHVRVAKATHMVAGDSNDAFTRAVRDFIQQQNT